MFVYLSLSSYLIARRISLIFLDTWYVVYGNFYLSVNISLINLPMRLTQADEDMTFPSAPTKDYFYAIHSDSNG